jgi:hypothetical protein
MNGWEFVSAMTGHILSWPVAILVLALVLLITQRKPLSDCCVAGMRKSLCPGEPGSR